MMLQHYLGYGDTSLYLKTLTETKDYNKAQQAVTDAIEKRTGKPAPTNTPIVDYITKFQAKLNNLPKSEESKVAAPTTPVKVTAPTKKVSMPYLEPSLTPDKEPIPTKPLEVNKIPSLTPNLTLTKEEITKNEVKANLKNQISATYKITPTDEQLEILTSDKPLPTKLLELKIVNPTISVEELNKLEKATMWANRAAVKQGLVKPNETEEVETKADYKSNVTSSGVNYIGEVKGDNSNYGTFYNKFDRNAGFGYVPIANVGKSNSKTKYNNVKGVAHFILDSDATDDYKHSYSQNYMKKQLNNENIAPGSTVEDQFLPVREKLKDGKVLVKYKKVSEIDKNDYVMAPLRQYKFTDINWEGAVPAEGFKSSIKALPTKTGEQTYFIFPSDKNGKSAYGKFGGGSVVFLANGKNFAVDFAGSINDIKNMADKIVAEEKIKPEDLVIAYHDLGSFSAKPKAVNNTLSFNQWAGFNSEDYTGGGLAFPSN